MFGNMAVQPEEYPVLPLGVSGTDGAFFPGLSGVRHSEVERNLLTVDADLFRRIIAADQAFHECDLHFC